MFGRMKGGEFVYFIWELDASFSGQWMSVILRFVENLEMEEMTESLLSKVEIFRSSVTSVFLLAKFKVMVNKWDKWGGDCSGDGEGDSRVNRRRKLEIKKR